MLQKSLLMIAFAFTLFTTAHAQIKKGGTWLGGGVSYNEQKTEFDAPLSDTKTRNVNISPAIGKVVKDNLVIGIALSYSNSNSKNVNNGVGTNETKGKGYGAGIFIRQYVPIVSRLYIFGQGNVNYSYSKSNQTVIDYSGNKTKYNTTGWSTNLSITPGVAVSVSKNLQLETGFSNLFHVGYTNSKTGLDAPSSGKTKASSFSAGVSLENQSAFYVGFRFLLNNKG